MTYVVTGACIRCKYNDSVEVRPVHCFGESDVPEKRRKFIARKAGLAPKFPDNRLYLAV